MTNETLADRAIRQRDIIPPDKLAQCHCTVIGVGAIGRQVALQLAAMGAPHLQLIDPDTVDVVNLANQGFEENQLGSHKVDAVDTTCRRLNSDVNIVPHVGKFSLRTEVGNCVFCCVDSITTRQFIFKNTHADFFTDGRMSAEVIRILTVTTDLARAYYPTTIFAENRAHGDSCTAKGTIYTANIAAGLMLSGFTQWLRGIEPEKDILLNLLTSEMDVTDHQ